MADDPDVRVHTQEYAEVPTSSLIPHPENPRDDNPILAEIMRANGFYGAVIVQAPTGSRKRDRILVGEHRWKELKAAGVDTVPVLRVFCDDDEARRIVVGDNAASDKGQYQQAALAAVLQRIKDKDGTLTGTGYKDADLRKLLAATSGTKPPSMLDVKDVAPVHPTMEPTPASVWQLGPHVLVVADVMEGWEVWTPHLAVSPDPAFDHLPAAFLPYPGPYAAHVTQAVGRRFVMVQPDPWIAGHILDKWRQLEGEPTPVREDG